MCLSLSCCCWYYLERGLRNKNKWLISCSYNLKESLLAQYIETLKV